MVSVGKRFFSPLGSVSRADLLSALSSFGIEYDLRDSALADDVLICDIAAIDCEALGGEGLYLGYIKSVNYRDLIFSGFGMLLLPRGSDLSFSSAVGVLCVYVDFPEYAFARLSSIFYPDGFDVLISGSDRAIASGARVSPSALLGFGVVIGERAVIGDGVRIDSHTVIGADCEIGANSYIGSGCVIRYCVMGSGCRVLSGAVIGERGFGLGLSAADSFPLPHIGGVVMGDFVEIGSNSTVDRGRFGDTVLCDGVKLDNLVHIGHNVRVGRGTVMAGQVGIAGSAVIGERVMIGGRGAVSDGVMIGDGAIIGASSSVRKDVGSGCRVLGTPAQDASDFMRSWRAFRQLGRG